MLLQTLAQTFLNDVAKIRRSETWKR